MTIFSKNLISWYLQNKRSLPWRETENPYYIWLSEIILQQTRVEQGRPYYLAFLRAFPTVLDLAEASEDEVLKLWQGLGYYSRARNLHATAKIIVTQYAGKFPNTYTELLKLKGVGDYTASAIASICFNEKQAVVDGNVYRVLSRVFGITTPIDSTEGKKEFRLKAQSLIDPKNPATYNQAIMEFGAVQCKPKNPDCGNCVFRSSCIALQTNSITQLPVKKGKTKVRDRYFNYMVILSKNKRIIIEQRVGKGIWQGLYQFPVYESKAILTKKEIKQVIDQGTFGTQEKGLHFSDLGVTKIELFNEKPIVHKLSHQTLYVQFWIVDVASLPKEKGVKVSELKKYAIPRVIDQFIKVFDFSE